MFMSTTIRNLFVVLLGVGMIWTLFAYTSQEVTPPALADGTPKFQTVDCAKDPKTCALIQEQIRAYQGFLKIMSSHLTGKGVDEAPEYIQVNGTTLAVQDLMQEALILQGYQYQKDEVKWMVEQAEKGEVDHIYLMFAINTEPASIAHRQAIDAPVRYLDAYFQVVTKEGVLKFGNFPLPCPNSCPPPDDPTKE